MCGIAGYSGEFTPELLADYVRILAHRGPDDFGTFVEQSGRVGLAHRRLSIIDLSARGHQPMREAAAGCVIVYNGELYNYRALRAQLVARGHRFDSDTDTEVLLNLYVEHGLDMLPMLDGMFAFAMWDPRTRELVLARDQMGIKPLYVAETPRGVLFASEMKALLASDSVPRTLDLRAVDATLRHLWCPGPRTLLEAVRKVEPGTALRVRDGKVRDEHRYWSIPVQEPWRDAPAIARGDSRPAMAALLERAVTNQMVSDVPIGAFLSGGLDSSAVVAIASRHTPRLPCFTIRFTSGSSADEGFGDDLPYARKVAAHFGTELIEVPIGAEIANELEQMIYQLDEPQADLAPINVGKIAAAARAHGIKVVLSGAGGDDLYAGYRRHHAVVLERYWAWLPRVVRRGLVAASAAVPAQHPLGRRFAKAFNRADLDADERLVGYYEWIAATTRREIFAPAARAELARLPRYDPLLASLKDLPRSVCALNKALYLDARYFLVDHNLNYTDKMAMLHAVEVRVPLLSVDLVRFAATLPPEDKLRGHTGKWIIREAMRDQLPPEILTRSKTGFGAPLRTWIHTELRTLVQDILAPDALRRRGLFDPAGVARLIEDDRAGRIDASYTILALVSIELWCRAFIDAA